MKVNRKYLPNTPKLSEYFKFIKTTHQVQQQMQELVPRNIDLCIEIHNDCTFINDEDGKPLACMSAGDGQCPDYLIESFALELRDLITGG